MGANQFTHTSPEERFFSKVRKSDGCWEWIAAKDPNGYGRFWSDGNMRVAPRWAYEHFVGPVPRELHVCHRCDNPSCVRPDHLFLGTNRENSLDALAKGRIQTGERSVAAKLTNDQVREIRSLAARGVFQRDIAEAFGVSQPAIHKVVHRKSYIDA